MPRILQCCPGCARQYDVGELDLGSPVRCSCGATFGVKSQRPLAPRALCCSRCGGTLQEQARACEYCQAEITLEERRLDSICPACFGRMASDACFCTSCGVRIEVQQLAPLPATARCPRCAPRDVALRSRRVGSSVLVECEVCAGTWVDPRLLERLCDDAEERKSIGEALGAVPSRGAGATTAARAYIPCPTCSQPMNRKNFGSISGILIDVCKDHGVWLDHGELARALEFAEQGGLVEARRREVRELEERRRRAQQPALGEAPGPGLTLSDLPLGRRSRRGSLGGLLGWLASELLE
jgi:Zn-finger nucleic acid-binding protein